ncbi:AAA family ATPase [Synechococcus sp. CS-1331]|uniref:AAA family ATPase n=1 Tax=Synechococcus sp. CS-1331 TaxID=2847973 RepID=UPI00223C1BBF|nr:AAA family ATPase [Synechococcus sp. CS-1331]MCT0227758.1 AAA family ATPase [Synechococcus sp. CS-1331]
MRLLHASLRQVRLHQHLELRFDPHFTLLGGANEAGKSTVVEALHKVLFLRASATGRAVDELRSRLHSGLPEIAVGFEAAGARWELRKRFSGASGTCQLGSDGGVALQGAAAEEQLARLLGVEGPIEGRRHGQLPQRWGHLWVRQGESGSNLLAGPGEAYDLKSLVQQLQQRGAAAALESPLDRLVGEQLQARLDLQFTATGKVKAGSPLAEARQRCQEAQAALEQAQGHRAELESAMEQLQRIGARLQAIDSAERPRLRRASQLAGQLRLRQAQIGPLQQQFAQLELALAEQQALQQQGLNLEAQQQAWQQQLASQLEEQATHQAGCRAGELALLELDGQQRELAGRLELAQELLDLASLEEEARQLNAHQQQFEQLQRDAQLCKQRLLELAPIDQETVRALRQAEQQLAQAQARSQAMATAVALLDADQSVSVGGQPLLPGETLQLSRAAELSIGSGVRLRISPGGGKANLEAAEALEARAQSLLNLQQQAGVDSSEAAEQIAGQRQELERELARLRQAAGAIPWSRLSEQIGALEPRRERLLRHLERHRQLRQAIAQEEGLPDQREGLESWLDALRHQSSQAGLRRQQLEAGLQARRQQLADRIAELGQLERQLAELGGSLAPLKQRQLALEKLHGTQPALAADLEHRSQELQIQAGEIGELKSSLGELLPEASAANQPDHGKDNWIEELIQQLDAEKDGLLTSRGHNEQLCLSLSVEDPAAAVDQCLARLESAQGEREAIERQTLALQILQSLFHRARQEFSQRYREPLEEAIGPYLEDLGSRDQQVRLDFDPKRGFGDFELQQGIQRYGFEQLSGGMREQLATALRLALAEVLLPGYDGCLPLIFDDAFTNSDPRRLGGLHRMLGRGLAKGAQIILLSCNPADYQEFATKNGSVITLP